MTTTFFSGSNSAIVYGGKFGSPFSNSGTMLIPKNGTNSEFRVIVTGTQLRLGIYADGTQFSYSVDGGAFSDSSPSGNNLQWLTIFTALSDDAHTVVIRPGTYTDYTNMLEVTGAVPAVAAVSGYSNNQYLLKTQTGFSTDNSKDTFGGTSVEGYPGVMTRGSCRFKATTDTIRLWVRHDAAGGCGLCIDGDADNLVEGTTAGTWGWVSFTGLDGTSEHTYRIIYGKQVYAYSVMVNGTLNTTALTAWESDYYQGDSITDGSSLTGADLYNFPVRAGLLLNRGWQIEGTAGGTAVTQGVAQKANPGASSPAPENVYIFWGYNDKGSYVDATFRTAITTIITQIAADEPTAKVKWFGIFPGSVANAFTAPTRAAMNTAISEQVTAFGDSDVTYVNTDSLSVVSTSDGTHPDATGAAAIGNFLAALLAPAAGGRTGMDHRRLRPY